MSELETLKVAVEGWVNQAELEETKCIISCCPGEVLYIATALRVLAEATADHAGSLFADGWTLSAESTQQRAQAYQASYQALCVVYK